MTSLHAALIITVLSTPDRAPRASRPVVDSSRAVHRASGGLARGFDRVVNARPQDASAQHVDCREWQACRQLATDAAARQDFEAFHDYAWRAVQTGPKNDPALMYLLARAQSLSGRPGDALVMLERLAAMGVPNDAATNDEFRRVRALAGWSAMEETVHGPGRIDPSPSGASRTEPVASGFSRTHGASGFSPASAPGIETLRFTTPHFAPAGLAYDAVSRRFIIGNRHARKLAVVDEFSQHVANLASAQATGFGEIAALEIDPHQGNLWVVTADGPQTTLHKLQLVSGRSLGSYVVDDGAGAARFVDVAATPQSAVLVLDGAGRRLFRLLPKAPSLQLAAALPDADPSSVAPAPDGIVYVAHARGLTRVDLSTRAATPLKAGRGIDLSGITRVRWHQGSLIAVQQTGRGSYRAVRIGLDRSGRTATAIELLDASLATNDPTAATVAGGALYYLANGEGTEMVVRRVVLR